LNFRLGGKRVKFPKIITRDNTEDLNSKSLSRLFPPGVADNFLLILDDN
jgi:hypothetical protein